MTSRTPILDALKASPVVSLRPKGLDLVRGAIAVALSNNVKDAVGYAASRWGEKSKAAQICKAAVPGLVTSTGAGDAMSDLANARTEFFDAVRAASIIGKLPVRRVGFRTRTLSMDEPPRVGWRAEGGAYLATPVKMTNVAAIERFDVGALLVMSKEVLEDESFNAEAELRDQLVKSLAAEIDNAFISPSNSGSGGVKPASITSGASAPASPSESLFDFGDAFTGNPNNAWVIINPWAAARLNGAARPELGARGGNWAGFPVITSTAMPDGFFAIVDPDQIAVAIGDANVRSSDVANVEMSDGPSMTSGPSVAAVSTVSAFQVNCRAVIASISANWRVVRDDAVLLYDLQSFGLAGGL